MRHSMDNIYYLDILRYLTEDCHGYTIIDDMEEYEIFLDRVIGDTDGY